MKYILPLGTLLAFLVAGNVSALDLSIEKNGEGSQNSITIDQQQNKSNTQGSSLIINNDIKANASTGNNTANGNSGNTTIVTGDATVQVNVQNTGNTNTSNNAKATPQPTPSGTPSNTPQPTQAPGNGGSSGGGQGGSSSSSNNGSGSQNNGTGAAAQGGEILGLAATDSDTTGQISTAIGILCLALAGIIKKFSSV